MNKTTKSNSGTIQKSLIDTKELMERLSCGRSTAVQIGSNACARIQIGKRVLWNIKKVDEYLDSISA